MTLFFVLEPILLLLLVTLSVMLYRLKQTVGFFFLMLASICYFVPHFAPFAIGFATDRIGNTSQMIDTWFLSSWSVGLGKTFDLAFLALTISATVSFIRDKRSRVRTSH